MNRKETTKFLGDLLVSDRLSGNGTGKYWAREVTLDYGQSELTEDGYKSKTRRIDFLQFVPENQLSVSGIEKGIFICYEIKSCKADFLSGYGQNFVGEKNYLVMTMPTYIELLNCGEINKLSPKIGILVPIPRSRKYVDTRLADEFENPTKLEDCNSWYFEVLRSALKVDRKRSMTELLFCMVRSGH